MRRNAENAASFVLGVIFALMDTDVDRAPSRDAAMNWVYPEVLPVCPYTVPQRVR